MTDPSLRRARVKLIVCLALCAALVCGSLVWSYVVWETAWARETRALRAKMDAFSFSTPDPLAYWKSDAAAYPVVLHSAGASFDTIIVNPSHPAAEVMVAVRNGRTVAYYIRSWQHEILIINSIQTTYPKDPYGKKGVARAHESLARIAPHLTIPETDILLEMARSYDTEWRTVVQKAQENDPSYPTYDSLRDVTSRVLRDCQYLWDVKHQQKLDSEAQQQAQ